MLDGLRALAARQPLIRAVRGLGLMIGVEFADAETADAVEIECFHHGVLTLRAGDSTIRMSPPLVINREQAATGLRIFEEACADVAARSAPDRGGRLPHRRADVRLSRPETPGRLLVDGARVRGVRRATSRASPSAIRRASTATSCS